MANVSELSGALLALWVARAEQLEDAEICGTDPGESPRCEYVKHEERGDDGWWTTFNPHTDWSIGGPLLDQHNILVAPQPPESDEEWTAEMWSKHHHRYITFGGPTALIAICRVKVASHYGDTVPDEA